MGMMSYFQHEEIKIINLEGLQKFFKEYIKQFPDSIAAEVNMLKQDNFTFGNWNDIKLISYWYKQDVLFLELVAPYIEGEVYWEYENNDESGWVEFSDGKCIFHIGYMEYARYNWKAMINLCGVQCNEKIEIPNELLQMKNNALLLRKIEGDKNGN